MALIRDNRGSLLASNLSQYLAGAANTAGTPVDTNELVRIVNQFLGTGEQISSDITTISNGIYKKFGTIGAAACDMQGNIAASTSTGGMTNKKYGRIGDSPIIGAGTYANNKTCAISCTGHGEPFIRAVAAHDVSCLMEYKGMTLQQAMNQVVNVTLVAMEGEGGMIGVDAAGNTSLIFNSAGMYRAMKNSEGESFVGIYKD